MFFVANFKTAMRLALMAGAASLALAYWAPALQGIEIGSLARITAGYGLAALAFMAFPTRRRADIGLWTVVFLSLVEVVGAMMGRTAHIAGLATDCLGVAGVMAPGWIEGLRRLGRDGDWALMGQRRRRGDRRDTLRSSAGQSPAV